MLFDCLLLSYDPSLCFEKLGCMLEAIFLKFICNIGKHKTLDKFEYIFFFSCTHLLRTWAVSCFLVFYCIYVV